MDDTSGPFRMVGLHYAFLPDTAAMYRLEDARGYEAMTLRRLFETYNLWCTHQPVSFNQVPDKRRPFLSALNVKYALGSQDEQPDEQWRLVVEDRQSRLFENTRVLPRAWVPKTVRYGRDAWDLTGMFEARDFGEVSWITYPEYRPHEISNGPGTLKIDRIGSAWAIDAEMENDGWVILSEAAWPGWRYYIDGKRVEWRYANHAFIGLFVPKGRHQLRVVYIPEAFKRGRNISVATLAALGLWGIARRRRARA
jgi:uncharacterized membrane protein YfhO